ncbi:MAG: iron-containing alcohol dehydrogenase [Spirochaetaceae bacterium]|nr:iron-containing alcohol dehydrogenase [Spirochaetaceae bacterium]
MIRISAPQAYYCQGGLLEQAGPLVREIASRVFIIAGPRAFDAVKEPLCRALSGAGVGFSVELYQGHTTAGDIAAIGRRAAASGAGAVLASGGGKVMDLAKAAGEEAGIPVITVPTIPSNCAAYTPLSVIYDSKGGYAGSRILKAAPRLVLADAELLARAPSRFLAAGMGDTLAKLLEAQTVTGHTDVNTALGISIARQAWDIVYPRGRDAFATAAGAAQGDPEAGRLFTGLLDAIVFLAGLIGSMRGGDYVSAYIHPLGDAFTKTGEGGKVHGEVIAFCNVVQAALFGQDGMMEELLAFNSALGLPLRLGDFGYGRAEEGARLLAETFDWNETAPLASTPFAFGKGDLLRAILRADKAGARCKRGVTCPLS